MISPATNAKRPPEAAAMIPVPVSPSHEALIRDAFDDIALLVGSIAQSAEEPNNPATNDRSGQPSFILISIQRRLVKKEST